MKSRRTPALPVVVLAAAAAVGGLSLSSTDAAACGGSGGPVWALEQHPDLPLDAFVRGRLGIVRPTWSRSFLAVAFRQLAGTALTEPERTSALRAWAARSGTPFETVSSAARTTSSVAGAPASPNSCANAPHGGPRPARALSLFEFAERSNRGRDRWFAALRAAGVTPPSDLATSITLRYASVENCLPDALESAASTLTARMQSANAVTPAVRAWADAQQLVFRNCDRASGGPFVPADLPATAAAPERFDRAYQVASARFYAGEFADAEARFRAIAAEPGSPWAPWGRYLAVRSTVRAATLAGARNDVAALRRAREELRAIVADRALAPAHAAARRYAVTLDAMIAPRQAAHELAVRLARDPLGEAFGDTLYDYAYVLDRDEGALAVTEPDADRLSAFLSVMQSAQGASFERATRLYAQGRDPVWLLAALLRAPNLADPALDPLLRAAESVPASNPAALSLAYLRAQAHVARRNHAAAFALASSSLAALGADELPTSRNLLVALAAQSAARFDDFARYATGHEAANDEEGSLATPTCTGPACEARLALHPEAARVLADRAPTSVWLRLARVTAVPERVRALLAAHAFVRAALLEDAALVRAAAPLAQSLNPALATRVGVVAAARAAPERTLALADLLLHSFTLGPTLRPGEQGPVGELTLDSSVGSMSLWCASDHAAAPAEAPEPAVFLTAPERAALARERAALRRLPAGPTYLAHQLATLAERFRTDPRTPELLHLAVRATRYGCRDAGVTAASREAFRVLHRLYPNNEFTRRTPYFY